MDINTEFKEVKLSDLLDKNEISQLQKLLKLNSCNDIRIFLNSSPLKEKLLEKGVLADYLYYYLQYSFGGKN